jgi:hypothetical protein
MALIPNTPSPSRDSIPSPLTTLIPSLKPEEASALSYSPDFYPGARDVPTPIGSMRVYEFGPQDGRKVLCIHGDANPSLMF